jgi:hypothetical protein
MIVAFIAQSVGSPAGAAAFFAAAGSAPRLSSAQTADDAHTASANPTDATAWDLITQASL